MDKNGDRDNLENVPTEKLEKMVKERKELIRKIYYQAAGLTQRFGKVVEREEYNDYTHPDMTLKSFSDFCFRAEGLPSIYVGRRLEIDYQSKPVFYVDCRGDEEFRIIVFEGGDWLDKFNEVVKNQDQSIRDLVNDYIAKLGENIKIDQFTRFEI